jgi:hypothetical protein
MFIKASKLTGKSDFKLQKPLYSTVVVLCCREALLMSNTSLLLEYTSRVFMDSLRE